MFGLLTKKIKTGIVPQLPEAVDGFEDIREEYNRVARKVGAQVRVSGKDHALRNSLRGLVIPVYDRAKVEKYMDARGTWGWYALNANFVYKENIRRVTPINYATRYGAMVREAYPRQIPLPVLLTVEKIMDQHPTAEFYVAALHDFPDPFLGVRLPEEPDEFFIVERWDEPSFRG